jgi:hypothetical protein
VIQSDVSSDAFTHFREVLGGAELHFSPKTSENLMLLAREFGHNSLITPLVPQRDFPRREESVHELLQGLDRNPRGTTIKAEFQSIRDGFADMQPRLSMIEEEFNGRREPILSELEKMTELVKQQSQKRPSNQRVFVTALIERIVVKAISLRSVNQRLFQEMVQRTNPGFSLPVYDTVKSYIKCPAEVYRITRASREKLLLFDGQRGTNIRPTFSGSHSGHGRTYSIHGLEGSQ